MRTLLRGLPWVVLSIITVALLSASDVPAVDIARYTAYLTFAVVLPGLLLHRAVFGVGRTWFHELTWGAITGWSVELVVWTLLTRVGAGRLTLLWVPAVLVAFAIALVRPTARRLVAARPRESIGASWAWSSVVLIVLLLLQAYTTFFTQTLLPTDASTTYQDLWWHLGLVHEAMRGGPIELPQAAGVPFHYHLLANADMALASQATGIDPAVLLLRLWIVPMAFLLVAVVTIAGASIARSTSAGPLAAWLTLGLSMRDAWWQGINGIAVGARSIPVRSPSQAIATPFFVAAVLVISRLFTRRPTWPQWVWSATVVIAAAGTKSTVLPILAVGTLCATVPILLRRSNRWRLALGILGILGLATLIMPFSSGSSGGRVTLFGTLRVLNTYQSLIGDTTARASDQGLLLDSVVSPRGIVIGGLSLLGLFGTQIAMWVGFMLWRRPSTRREPVLWFLSACWIAGWAATFAVDHIGLSQNYFARTVVPIGAILTAWLTSALLHEDERPRAEIITTGILLGIGLHLGWKHLWSLIERLMDIGALDRVVLPAVSLIAVAAIVLIGSRYNRALRYVATGSVASIAVLSLTIVPTFDAVVIGIRNAFDARPEPVDANASLYVSAAEQEAAMWLREASSSGDVVLSNVHCLRPTEDLNNCRSRSWWVSALTGRRIVIESWAYTNESLHMHLLNGRSSDFQYEPWMDRIELSQSLIEHADPAAAEVLVADYDAEWIFVAHRFGSAPPELGFLAELMYDNGEASIYRLK